MVARQHKRDMSLDEGHRVSAYERARYTTMDLNRPGGAMTKREQFGTSL